MNKYNKYQKAVVYKIYNKLNPEEFYIGSTIRSLSKRFQAHKTQPTTSLHKFMLEKGFDNFDIELVCCYENCENKIDLHKLEQEIIEELKPTINKYRAYNSEEYNKEYFSQYRIDNKETIKEYFSQYCIDNKETIKEYSSQYRIDNKESINEKAATKFVCICGKEMRKSSKNKHERSIFHQDFIKNLI